MDARRLNILIVEDHADTAETLATLIDLYGHRVRSAGDGEEALRLARELQPDVAILDLGLPNMDGFAVAGELIATLKCRPLIIVVSGYANKRTECLAAGVDLYYVKPVEPAVLEGVLKTHIEKLDRIAAREVEVEDPIG